MSNSQIVLYEIKGTGSGLCNQYRSKALSSDRAQVQDVRGSLSSALFSGYLNVPREVKVILTRFFYASMLGLTGCATSAEIDSLRAEVLKANAVAARAEARASSAQRQLAALKEASESREPAAEPAMVSAPPSATPVNTNGYKWGNLRQE